jgi:alkylation response protein AidB-like acyl-CoA dehydrogenase
MRFALTDDQRDFTASLDALLAAADPVAAARAWADGDHGPGLDLWARLGDMGVPALLVPENDGGLGATPVELVIALELIGKYAVPGPWVESAGYLATCDDAAVRKAVAAGTVATLAAPAPTPYALDADIADLVLHAEDGVLNRAEVGEQVGSIDPARRLFRTTPAESGPGLRFNELVVPFDTAVLATSAQLLGAGERVLADAVDYVKQRTQFGRPIGSYQAIKHQLADVRIALDFARPLLYAAALQPVHDEDKVRARMRDVSAAKVACGDAAYLSARTALQVHGAIGYTQEYDLSLWLLKIRALASVWGTGSWHRERILDIVTGDRL